MKLLAKIMLCFMISFSLVEFPIMKGQAMAGMISTSAALADMNRAQGEQNIKEFLNRGDVQKQLQKMGFSSQDAAKKVALLSDKEVKKLSQDIEKASVGGDIGGILIVVLVIILIIYFAKRI
jgi:hypothetical protein